MKHELRWLKANELRVVDGAEGKLPKLAGYAAVFDSLSEPLGDKKVKFREKIAPGAFKDTLASGEDVLALANHDTRQILARTSAGTLKLREDKKGLHVEITPPDTTVGRDTVENVRNGNIKGMSFGFSDAKDSWERAGDENIRTLHKIALHEVTLTPIPAYEDTSIDLRSAEREINKLELRATIEMDDDSLIYVCRDAIRYIRCAFDSLQSVITVAARVQGDLNDQDQMAIDDCVGATVDLIAKARQCRATLEAMGAEDDAATEAAADDAAMREKKPETTTAPDLSMLRNRLRMAEASI